MRYARAAALLAAAIISPTLAACASDNSGATTPAPATTSESGSSSDATKSSSPGSADGSATVGEYASIVAQYAASLKADIRDGLDPEQCSWGLGGPPDRDSTGHCYDSAQTIQRGARNLADELTSAQADDALGAPPQQIAKLVKDTIKVAESTDKRAEPALRCAQDYIHGCNPKAARWSEAMHDMRDQLAAWSPYL